MNRYILSAALAAVAVPGAALANEDCGEITIAEMNWASAGVVVAVSNFLLEQGYGCDVTVVPSDTTPAVTSLSENNEPDIVPERWPNSAGDAYKKIKADGKIVELTSVLEPGGVEGWWIPTYLAEAHPELKTIEGVMANPELVGGMFNNCPDGWGCRIVNDNLIRAMDLEGSGIEVFNHGSGETLATSMASAVQSEEPWFGYYWGPTAVLGKYKMTKVTIGDIDAAVHTANQNKENSSPAVSDFPPAPVLTVATAALAAREPAVAELMGKVSFEIGLLSGLLAWQDANSASAEEAAVHFLTTESGVWSQWVNEEARGKLSAFIK